MDYQTMAASYGNPTVPGESDATGLGRSRQGDAAQMPTAPQAGHNAYNRFNPFLDGEFGTAYRTPSTGSNVSSPIPIFGGTVSASPPNPMTESPFSTSPGLFEESSNMDYNWNPFMGFGEERQDFALPAPRRPFLDSGAPITTPAPLTSRRPQYTGQPTQQQSRYLMPQYVMSQFQANNPAQSGIHNMSSGASSVNRNSLPRYSSNVQSRRPAVSPPATQRRRQQHRTHMASHASPNPQLGSPQSTNRTRRSREESQTAQLAQLAPTPAQRQRTQPAQTPAPAPAAPAAPPESPPASQYVSMLTQQQRLEMVQRHHLELLRRISVDNRLNQARMNEARAIQAYEENVMQRNFQQYIAEYESMPSVSPSMASKSLDDQSDGRPEPKESEEMAVSLECRICMCQVVDTVMLPCGHAILCQWCADQHMPSSRVDKTRPRGKALCPMCRTPVRQKLRLYFS